MDSSRQWTEDVDPSRQWAGGVCLGGVVSARGVCLGDVCQLDVCPHPGPEADTPRMTTAADGTHPTGMHSCRKKQFILFLSSQSAKKWAPKSIH